MRDLFVAGVVFASLPLILWRPYIGVIMWAWLGFMNPHRLAWGFAVDFPFAQIVAITTFVGILFSPEPKRIPWTRETVLLLIFVSWMLVTTFLALNQEGAWVQWGKVWKIQLMVFVTLMLMRTPARVQALIWTIALSLGFYGVKGGIFTITTGGVHQVRGPFGSFISGNNEIGLAMIMVIPLIRYLQLSSKRWWIRQGLLAAMALTVFAILGTHSRGALVGLAAMLLFLLLKSRKRLIFVPTMALAIYLSLQVMPRQWFERMETIQTYEQDASATGRINSWWFAFNLAKVRPFVGGGFETFRRPLFKIYAPDPDDFHDAHSIYFEVLGEHGFVGLGLFLTLGWCVWRSCRRLIKLSKSEPEFANHGDLGRMIQVSLVGYAAAGTFLGLAYFDLYYNLVAIIILARTNVAEILQERESKAEATSPLDQEMEYAPVSAGGH